MSKSSKAKRDKKKKKKLNRRCNPAPESGFNPLRIKAALDKLFDPKKLTAPAAINADITGFCAGISNCTPFFLDVTPEPWSRQSCCDLNVMKYIEAHGGEMVCGYKIWYHKPAYIEAERHAVWRNGGEYRDVSFNADGENRILFVPDVDEKQGDLKSNVPKMRWGKDAQTSRLVDFQNNAEVMIPVYKMSNEDAWETMLTYDKWLEGERMPSVTVTGGEEARELGRSKAAPLHSADYAER